MTSDVNEPQWLSQARSLSTAEVSDALDFFNLPGSALGIRPIAGPAKIFGQAFTVRFAAIDHSQPGTVGDFIDRLEPDSVAVMDNGGRLDCTVWGGILSQLAAQKRIGGTVVNGVCRDTAEADEAGYPLYACGKFMRTGKDRVQVEAYEQPVMLGDVRVCQGDLVIGDADGVVVVPRLRMQEVLTKALETRVVEAQILEAALDGMPLVEARKKYGYHTLQRSATTLAA
ncbi:RraA family protein [Variovorax ginsengisoli]|uniref:RraA family protein n=1 Tax=Variovorax ginsengisoli TaxID=363844 RepID=UPI0034563CEB